MGEPLVCNVNDGHGHLHNNKLISLKTQHWESAFKSKVVKNQEIQFPFAYSCYFRTISTWK